MKDGPPARRLLGPTEDQKSNWGANGLNFRRTQTVGGGILPEYAFDTAAPAVSASVPLLNSNVGNESGMQVPGNPEREVLTYEDMKRVRSTCTGSPGSHGRLRAFHTCDFAFAIENTVSSK